MNLQRPAGVPREMLRSGFSSKLLKRREKMNRKIIIKSDDFHKEISSFLTEVAADMPLGLDTEVLDSVGEAVIEAFKRMGVKLEVDEGRPFFPLAEEMRNQAAQKRFIRGYKGSPRDCKHHRSLGMGSRSIPSQEGQGPCLCRSLRPGGL